MFRRQCGNCRELTRALRERDQKISELLDRLMVMADRPWAPAPASLVAVPQEEEAERLLLDPGPESWPS